MSHHNPSPAPYRGRFAPSPTGPLHFGSLVAAVGSYLQARASRGRWLVRMEDLDPPREMPGAADAILRTLERFALEWDEEVLYQSRRSEAYEVALARLDRLGMLYPCGCSRKEVATEGRRGEYGVIYSGRCRGGLAPGKQPRALRVRVKDEPIEFIDRLRGGYGQNLAREVGDFVVRRADGFYAYQLAVVVDDGFQGITEVVRGADLLDNTPRQIHLQRLLGMPTPSYLHLPVALNRQGQKLSKQNRATAIDHQEPGPTLALALDFLGHPPPAELRKAPPRELLEWAVAGWSPARVPATDRTAPGALAELA